MKSSEQIYGFSNIKETKNVSLNAKKLDIDFNNEDDFFNSFNPTSNAIKVNTGGLVEAKSDANPFKLASDSEVIKPKKVETSIGGASEGDRNAFV